jgi:hypothetical protein
MIHLILSALWDSAFAQFGLAGLVLIGAVAVFLWVPLPGARHIAVATVCVIFFFAAPKLYIEGIRHEKARWDAAERNENSSPVRSSEPRILASPIAPATNHIRNVLSGGFFSSLLKDGIHNGPYPWNGQWGGFIEDFPEASPDQIHQQLNRCSCHGSDEVGVLAAEDVSHGQYGHNDGQVRARHVFGRSTPYLRPATNRRIVGRAAVPHARRSRV